MRSIHHCTQPVRRYAATMTLALLMLTASSASAERKVFLNGVDLSDVDVRGHEFEGAKVRFDGKGNVHITVKGLKISTASSKKSADDQPKKKLGKRYFLVVKPVKSGGEKYRVSVYINGTLARLVRGEPRTQVHEITKYVASGENAVRMVSALEMGGGDRRKTPSHDLEIVLGQGTKRQGTVLIQVPLVEYRRSAADSRRYDKGFRFKAR